MAVAPALGVDQSALLAMLADGRRHSGEALATRLGVSRTAVWKAVDRLRARGIDIEAVARRGYALPRPVELLDAARIGGEFGVATRDRLRRLELQFEVDSTNSRLLCAPPPPPGLADVLLCELQHAGRGRRGRHWAAPFGGSLALSIAWSFTDAAHAAPTLSLCVGVAAARALTRVGARGIGVKWPNDLWFEDRKLGGVLIELRAEAGGPAHAVIGIGINVGFSAAERANLQAAGLAVAAVEEACAAAPSRNAIAGALIDEVLVMLADFERCGFSKWRDPWLALDVLKDRPARAHRGDAVTSGTARGVDAHGALQLECDGRLLAFVSGEVSLRLGGDDP